MTRNKLGSLALAFAIALSLWMYVITYVSTDHEMTLHNVPVALEGKSLLSDRGFMILNEEDFSVDLKLSGSRQDVSKCNSGNIHVVADLTDIYDPGEHNLTYSIIYPGDVPTNAVKAQRDPDRVTVIVAKRKTKQIPVEVRYQGDVPADYIKDTAAVELDNQFIEISGPESVVDQIDHAAITVDCTGRTESIYESYRYELQNAQDAPVDAHWITTNVSEVKVYLPVSMVKTLPLTLTVIDGGGATASTTKLVFDPASISVSGSETALAALEELNIGTIDLSQITEDQVLTFEISLPEGIRNVSNLPTASVHVTFPRLATREFTITEFEPLNLAAGKKWESLTRQLTITVRGLKSEVQRLNPEDIIVRIDLGAVENTSAVEPDIVFPKSFESLGVLGSYSISVQVTEASSVTEE